MGLNPDTARNIVSAFNQALDVFYGSSVATMDQFKAKRRATYMAKLEEIVGAVTWRKNISVAVEALGRAKGVYTRLSNEKQSHIAEMKARHDLELAQLREKQAKEINEWTVHYEPTMLEADAAREARGKELDDLRRASYFAGLDIEDDGRQLYFRSDKEPLDTAISERVGVFMDHNIGDDPEGVKVLTRQRQTILLKDIVNFVKDLAEMRKWVLWKIEAGQLPPVTIDAWWIKDGMDVMPK